MFLDKYKKNYYSQNGEDGIIKEIIKRTRIDKKKNNWCCEFGAWDGKHGSNTYNLVLNHSFKAVYIEGNKDRFLKLKELTKKVPKIFSFNKYISHKKKSKNCLDNVLKKTKIKKNFEILSIDIDSYDLDVWDNLKKYNPIIVVIEINSGIKPGIYQKHSKHSQGNSFSSTLSVAKKKGYILLSHTGNCIFIKKTYKNKMKISDEFINNPNKLFDWSWALNKENIIKRFIKFILPLFVLDFLRKLKSQI